MTYGKCLDKGFIDRLIALLKSDYNLSSHYVKDQDQNQEQDQEFYIVGQARR